MWQLSFYLDHQKTQVRIYRISIQVQKRAIQLVKNFKTSLLRPVLSRDGNQSYTRMYTCEVCDKRFQQPASLLGHYKAHAG